MLDRTIAPEKGKIEYTGLQKVSACTFKSGIPLFYLNAGEQPVVKIEIVFQSGIWFESKKSESWFTSQMLTEGTSSKSAKEITEGFESLGAFLEISPGFDDVSVIAHGLQKNFPEVLELLNEILIDSIFPEKELEILKSNRKDQIELNKKKTSMHAFKKIREAIYGSSFTYGQSLTASDIEEINTPDLKNYYKELFFNRPKIFLSGKVSEELVQCAEEIFSFPCLTVENKNQVQPKSSTKNIYVEREGSLQSSIRMAWIIPRKDHSDYFHYLIANNLLGGYFGSRLMKNIREDKGYTYGINAYPVHLKNSSFGIISTDVKADHTRDTCNEINKEIEKLKTQSISNSEIETLANYMTGSFLSSINTPFQLMEKFQKTEEFGLDATYYDRFIAVLKIVNSADIQEVMNRYFKLNEAYSAIVGLNK